jgi:hypothetical protein
LIVDPRIVRPSEDRGGLAKSDANAAKSIARVAFVVADSFHMGIFLMPCKSTQRVGVFRMGWKRQISSTGNIPNLYVATGT